MIVEHLLELGERGAVLDHGELAVRIADVISRGELDRVDVQFGEFLQDLRRAAFAITEG